MELIHSNRRLINAIFKLAVIVGLAWVVYRVYSNQGDFSNLWDQFLHAQRRAQWHQLILVLFLMPVNWWLESIRWKLLNRPVWDISQKAAIKSVLMGVALSIFTPNRVGEYLGRILNIPAKDKWKALLAQLLGSLIQLVLIACCGAWALMKLGNESHLFSISRTGILGLILVILLMGLVAILNGHHLSAWIAKRFPHPRLSKVAENAAFLKKYQTFDLIVVFVCTTLRLGVYVFQYVILLRFFQIDAPVHTTVIAVLATYFIQSGLPLPTLLGLVARGEIALFVWSFLEVNELSVLAASYMLWVINVLVPALIGSMYVFRIDIATSFGFDKK